MEDVAKIKEVNVFTKATTQGLKKLFKGLMVVGAVSAAFECAQAQTMADKMKTAVTYAGEIAGSLVGGILGVAAGPMGAAAGSVAGGMLGQLAGEFLGDKLFSASDKGALSVKSGGNV